MADEIVQPVEPKPIWQSKTLWIQVLGIVALVIPQTSAFIGEHFAAAGIGWALINTVLRLVTKGKVELV